MTGLLQSRHAGVVRKEANCPHPWPLRQARETPWRIFSRSQSGSTNPAVGLRCRLETILLLLRAKAGMRADDKTMQIYCAILRLVNLAYPVKAQYAGQRQKTQ